VIALAHALGMRVVAEGVDSAESLAVVAELGCETGQGFFIGRPMRGDLVPEWIEQYLGNATNARVRIIEPSRRS
jgi:EAL domain-containing protein (putative c-di-GMP-specific phosphodiesterase class I)